MRSQIKNLVCRSISAMALMFVVHTSIAAPIVQPMGLNFGDQYRLAFLTNGKRNAASGNVADYNAFVTNAANAVSELAALGTTWSAIAATATNNGHGNTNTNPGVWAGLPIYLLDGSSTPLANDNADLWDQTIGRPFNIDENGQLVNLVGDHSVWTGTNWDGTKHGNHLGQANVVFGRDDTIGPQFWVLDPGGATMANLGLHRMYAISGNLSAVPLPPAAALLGLPLLALLRRRVPS